MKDYSKLTTEELVKEYEDLETARTQDYAMDGSGDCGHLIDKHYTPHFDAILKELNNRGENPFAMEVDEYLECDEMPY